MNKTRFAPSPTGHLHIGGARTAIISWLIAQKLDGKFVLRIEDTDVERSKPEYTQSIMNSLSWLGISHDEGPYYQMQRLARYQAVAQDLVAKGLAYYCYTTPEQLTAQRDAFKQAHGHDGWKYDRAWRDATPDDVIRQNVQPVIRLKVPLDGFVAWNDLTKGQISIPNTQLDDFIIMRSDGVPTYNFCVVVDDMDMGINYVVRGDDHINNTPKQIHIYQALGANVPTFGHIPLILNMDGKKQSKRDDSTSVNSYQAKGYLPEAIVNYLLLISCNDVGREIFTKEEFVDLFQLNKLGNTPIKFDQEKLLWINQQYIKNMPDTQVINILKEDMQAQGIDLTQWQNANFDVIVNPVKERSKLTTDFYFVMQPLLNWKPELFNDELMHKILVAVCQTDIWTNETLHQAIDNIAQGEGKKFGQIVKPLRQTVFNNATLPLSEMFLFFGKDAFIQLLKQNKQLKP